jgi:cobalt/nickel transport system permease protein
LAEAIARELSTPAHGSWLARIEPRAKIVGVMALVVSATFLQRLEPLSALLVTALILSASSRLSIARLVRVWLGVPLFSLAIILPAMLNVVTHGPPVLTICHFAPGRTIGPWALPDALAITSTGLIVASRFLLRSLSCVTLVLVLVATTDASALLNALRRLGMPRVFGMVLTMSHRYLVVVLRVAEEIHLAKLSRTITAGPLRHEQRWVAAGIGILFRRTHQLAHEVHEAMLSRGYDGDLQVGARPRLQIRDWIWLGVVALVITGLALTEHLI